MLVIKTHKHILLLNLILKFCMCDYLYPGTPAPSLPEIIINKNIIPNHSFSGYHYPVPQPPNDILPPLQDDIPTTPIDDGYLPPPSNEYLPPPANDFQPFQPVPAPIPHPVYGVPTQPQNQPAAVSKYAEPYVRVVSMSCLDSSDSRFFRAVVQSSDFIKTPPVFTKTAFGCTILKKSNDAYIINLEGLNVGNCGVRYCANKKMCLNLRLPTVAELQLPEDRIVSLQCSPQHSIASVVKSLGIKTQKIQPRTIGFNTIASGGSQRAFRPQIALYRRGNQLVEPGSSVLLGEDLLLKATIYDSEDWKFVKIGTVLMQQGVQSTQTNSETRKSVTLVDNDGCRVESMKSVCPNHPEQLTNKVTVVPFRAFLFQDVDSDEMLLSVRLFGCMHQKDCQQTKHCEEKAVNTLDHGKNLSLGRRKRMVNNKLLVNSTKPHESNYYSRNDSSNTLTAKNINRFFHDTIDYESHLDFRVVLNDPYKSDNNGRNTTNHLNFLNNNINKFMGDYSGWSMDDFYNGYLFISVTLIVALTCIFILWVVITNTQNSKKAYF